VVVADTGAVLALLDRHDAHHAAIRAVYEADPDGWLLPWAILPEVDYLAGKMLGERARRVWLADVAEGAYAVEWGADGDLKTARAIDDRYAALCLGLVDAVVMAIAERIRADIATLDLRHFGAVTLAHRPRLFPRDGKIQD
jgi:predicted nucleic acid-binding protein